MKQLFSLVAVLCVLAACNNNKAADEAASTTTAETNKQAVDYPFTPEKPYRNWQIGSEQNTVTAMNALKSFIDSDFNAFAGTLADSLEIAVDGYKSKMSRDSAVAFFTAFRPTYKDLKIDMYDWISVISEDKKEEWVTFWYKQKWTNEKGNLDSMEVVDDIKMENGKMAELDEKIRHYPAK